MEKSYVDEEEVKQNFKENNKEILGINEEKKLRKEIEVRNALIREKEAKMKKFKRLTGVYVVLSALAMGSLGSYSSIIKKQFDLYKNRISTVYDSGENKNTIENVDSEVLRVYSDYVMNEYQKTLSFDEATNEKQLNAFKDTYYYPLREALDDYKYCDSKDKDLYKEQLNKKSNAFNDTITKLRNNLSFSNTVFSRAKYIDGEVCVPSPYIIENSELSNNQVIDPDDNKSIYIPISELSEDDIKSLGK